MRKSDGNGDRTLTGVLALLGVILIWVAVPGPSDGHRATNGPGAISSAPAEEQTVSVTIDLPACEDMDGREGSCLIFDDYGDGAQLYLLRSADSTQPPMAVSDLPTGVHLQVAGLPLTGGSGP